jgi:hypothetical protein
MFWTVETIYTPYNASAADPMWTHQSMATLKSLPQADFIELEPRVEFHRFTDMELIATAAEVAMLKSKLPASQRVVVFPEDRTNPLRLTNVTDLLPMRWAQNGPPNQTFSGSARRGEWYAFQLGVWAVGGPVQIHSTEFHSDSIPGSAFTCINLGGVDETGAMFTKTVYLAAGQLNSLWCGVQIPLDVDAGSTVKATVALSFEPSEKPAEVDVSIQVSTDAPLFDHGDADVWRMSRLRWLDSTIGSDDSEVPMPYLKVNHTESNDGGLVARILGRTVDLAPTGLPASISATRFGGHRMAKLLNSPMELKLISPATTALSEELARSHTQMTITESSSSKLSWSATSSSQVGSCELMVNGSLWFDGYGIYSMTISAPAGKSVLLEDIQLRINLNESIAKFMMGFGRSGGAISGGFGGLPLHWKWGDGPYQIWAGNTDAGMRFKLTGPEVGWAAPSYSYGSNPPVWENGGKGGANITERSSGVEIVAFTGPIGINGSRSVTLYFEMLLTPVKPLNRGVNHPHWGQRHYQVGYGANGSAFATPAEVARTGATVANLHQGIGAGPVAWQGHTDVDEGLLNPLVTSRTVLPSVETELT